MTLTTFPPFWYCAFWALMLAAAALVLHFVVTKPIVAAISRHLDYWKGQ